MPKENNMAMVLQALKNAGLNDNQARILGAEIGRENAFEDKYLWGYHTDAANGNKNIGIISWQKDRAAEVEKRLRQAGLIQDGKIVKGQASLDVMAKYLVHEIRTDPKYTQTKKLFLDNPNVDYTTGARVLGKNFIRWAYDNPRYKSGHKNRDNFYAQLGGVAPAGGEATQFAGNTADISQMASADVPPPTLQPPALLATGQVPQTQVDMFGGMGNQNVLGLNLDLMSVLNGMGATQQQSMSPMLPTPFS